VFNDVTGISGALAGNANTLNGLRYSRSLEAEADEKGLDLLLSNGVDVKGYARINAGIAEGRGSAWEPIVFEYAYTYGRTN
jgi:hypothetical protein